MFISFMIQDHKVNGDLAVHIILYAKRYIVNPIFYFAYSLHNCSNYPLIYSAEGTV
ncbi:hypothetical protein C824_003514 [Schaedlerella arabinosiphila]|nr:hypothetical protein C824_003514 [Schaedlerella arabinosiphila]